MMYIEHLRADMRGERERIPPSVEMSRNTEVERGVPEELMATCQQGTYTQEDPHWYQGQRIEKFRCPRLQHKT
jgi:hypothetical protein